MFTETRQIPEESPYRRVQLSWIGLDNWWRSKRRVEWRNFHKQIHSEILTCVRFLAVLFASLDEGLLRYGPLKVGIIGSLPIGLSLLSWRILSFRLTMAFSGEGVTDFTELGEEEGLFDTSTGPDDDHILGDMYEGLSCAWLLEDWE